MSSAQARRRPELAELLRRPRYPSFALTVLLARSSSAMFNVSAVLLVLARTGSAPLAGVTAAAAVLPGAVTGPMLGAWLEVVSRRRVWIVFDQLLSVAGLLGVLLLAGHGPNWTVPAVAIVYSVTRPISSGTFYSALGEIAGAGLLDMASTIEASSLNLSIVVGPALAGLLAGATSPATAIVVQAAVTVAVAALVAINPAFEARSPERVDSVAHALREGTRALVHDPVLRTVGLGSTLAAFGWGLMMIGFPLYAARTLHAGAHAGGYLWAGVAFGSILGTFALRGSPTLRRIGASYGILGASALVWPLAHSLALGIVLVTVTGFLEGPAYSDTIALRQRHTPPAVRAQVMTTTTGIGFVAISAGSAIGGVVHAILPLAIAFAAINAVASFTAARMRTTR
ncbi:MAG TPA: MFS transporter [Solirubrobacteraceae bacterium]|nr:MFS transporter [Solirubrobacteraceae bacterium]